MTEQEYVRKRFEEHFLRFKGKRIVLYGGGTYTRLLLKRFDQEYHFVGVLLDNAEGFKDEIPGKQCFQLETLPRNGLDMIILSEHKRTGEPDYQRICGFCEKYGILLYDMYGIDEISAHDKLSGSAYKNLHAWKKFLIKYDVICFAAMDTYTYMVPEEGNRLYVREIFRTLTIWLREQGKQVIFASRHAVSEEKIRQFFLREHLAESEEELDSILYMRRGEDLGFRKIRERFPDKRIIHIGTSIGNDGIIPQFYDIDTYCVEEFDFSLEVMHPAYRAERIQRRSSGLSIQSRSQVLTQIDAAQIVSFDIFDTLLMRTVLDPEDVFELVEQNACCEGTVGQELLSAGTFSKLRSRIMREHPEANFQRIYDILQKESGISAEDRRRLMATERSAELQVTKARQPVAELLQYAIRKRKRVVLTSDMYLPASFIQELLCNAGITGYEKIFVSCEENAGKQNGLFQRLCALAKTSGSILHIGDNFESDIVAAEQAGIKTVWLPSAKEMAMHYGWEAAITEAESFGERSLVGMAITCAFADPFQNPQMKDIPEGSRLARYGASVAAPVILGYIYWLIKKIQKEPFDGVLFAARDGYLLKEFYDAAAAKIPAPLPASTYFYTSRRAAYLPIMDQAETFSYVVGRAGITTVEGLMESAFDLHPEQILPYDPAEELTDYVKRHLDILSKQAKKANDAFMWYCDRMKFRRNGRYAFTDFVAEGSCQSLLSRYAPFRMKGFYFGLPMYAQEKSNAITYFLEGENPFFLENYIEMESVMTSPEPSLDGYTEDGRPIFASECRSAEEQKQMRLMHQAVREFCYSFLNTFGVREDIRPGLIEEIYAADGYHNIPHEIFDDWMKAKW